MNTQLILSSIAVFLVVILLLVIILLLAKRFLLPGGNIKVKIHGEKEVEVVFVQFSGDVVRQNCYRGRGLVAEHLKLCQFHQQ